MTFFPISSYVVSVGATATTPLAIPGRADAGDTTPIAGGVRLIRNARIIVPAGGADLIYFRFGNGTVAATVGGTADRRMLPGAVEEFAIPIEATHVSFIATGAGPTSVAIDFGSQRN